MKQNDRFQLTENEMSSALWLRMKAHYEKRLHSLRSANDDPTSEEETARRRGRIHEVKLLLSLDTSPVTIPRE